MQHLEVSGAVRHIYIYIYVYVIRRLKVTICLLQNTATRYAGCEMPSMQQHKPVLFTIKPTRCTSFPNLLRYETLHVSGCSSAYHQEFIHSILSNVICHRGL